MKERNIHRLSLAIGGLTILLPLIFWKKIPDQIPMHYNAKGVVDNWADKSSLILLFFLILMLMGVMSIAVYVVKSSMESKYAKEAEKSEMRLVYPIVVVMNLVVQLMFAYIMFCCVTCRALGKMFLPSTGCVIVGLLTYMIVKHRYARVKDVSHPDYRELEKEESGKIYRSAVDWWLGLVLIGCMVLMIWVSIYPIIQSGEIEWLTIVTTIITTLLLIPLFFIRYEMYSNHLLVSMGFYGKVRICYSDIVNVKKTNNPLSSAAMSLRRVQIDYVQDGVHRMILISPKNRNKFIEELEEKRSTSS